MIAQNEGDRVEIMEVKKRGQRASIEELEKGLTLLYSGFLAFVHNELL